MSNGHAAIVLAAGGSRRLGHPKQLLTRSGETLVHRMVRLVGATAPSQLLVVVGTPGDAVAAAVADLPCEVLPNPGWETGLSASLRHAAQRLRAHGGPVLIVACDQPALDSGHLQRLLEGAAEASSGCAATAHGDQLGIPAVVSASVFQQAHVLTGDRGFGAHLSALPAAAVARLIAPELQLDIDTPENEQAAIARGLLDVPTS
jgi:molybdenum cofactor cytidylyltransferase